MTDDHRVGRALQLIGAAVAVRLVPLGWSAEMLPGDEAICCLASGD